MKLVLVNSIGPMGCACTCSIIEHLGYINLPVRKRQLTQYVLGKKDLNDNYFKKKTLELINIYSMPRRIGGTSVFDRELNLPKKLYDKNLIKNELDFFMNKKYSNISDMYFDSMTLFNKATIYKKKILKPLGSIEQIIDIHNFYNFNIYEKYMEHFKDIVFINLDRNFFTWISAISGQNFMRDKLSFNDLKFGLIKYYDLYLNHINYFEKLKGYNYKFEEIFLPNTKNFIKDLCLKLYSKEIANYELLTYDSYGHMYDYNSQFTYQDQFLQFLSDKTINFAKYIIQKYNNGNKFLSFLCQLLFQFFYLRDLLVFRKKNKKVIKHEILKEDFYSNIKKNDYKKKF